MLDVRRGGLSVLVATLALLATETPLDSQASSRSARADEVLGLLGAELVQLDLPPQANGPVQLPLFAERFVDVLVLEPQEPDAHDYELWVQGEGGSFAVTRGDRPQTFRGALAGHPGSVASGTLSDEGLFVRILLFDGESLWLEPLAGRVAGATAQDYVLYADGDVVEQELPCVEPLVAAGTSATSGDSASATSGEPSSGAAGTVKIAELACDTDYEYFLDHGSSVSTVEARIHSIVDAINLQYEAEVGIRHVITTIVVRTSASDPYVSTDPSQLLVEFRNEWNAVHGGIQRDTAHLFTGKQLAGSVIGIAYLGVICNGTYGYGLSQSDFTSSFAYVTDLTAHEIGHNWNAPHCSCTSYTMNPYITGANAFEPTATIPTIVAFRDSRACLDVDDGGTPPPPPPPPPGDPEINLTTGESLTAGTITAGSHATTHAEDDVYEVLQEVANGGKPSSRVSRLSHTWTFDVLPGLAYTFSVDAHHSNNLEGDDFRFSYSRNGVDFTEMLVVSKTADDDSPQSFAFPEDVSGPLSIRVEDTDRTNGNGAKDSLFVDHLVVRSHQDGMDTTPPSAPTGLTVSAGDGSVGLDWNDSPESDLAGYAVHRSTTAGGPYTVVASALSESAWTDASVTNGTTYFYVVIARDLSGNESAPSVEVMATPNVAGTPSSVHVASILVTNANQGGGHKMGRADVVLANELGDPVADAIVTGSFSGDLNEIVVGVTDASGAVTFFTTDTKKGGLAVTFCVDDVQHPSLNYSPTTNQETCDVN